MRRTAITSTLLCCLAAFGLAACSSSGAKGSSSSGSGSGATITIKDTSFTSVPTVKAGEKITVTNADSIEHTVTADNGQFDVPVNANSTTTFTAPSTPGSYPFHCNFHPTVMKATLIVT